MRLLKVHKGLVLLLFVFALMPLTNLHYFLIYGFLFWVLFPLAALFTFI